MNDISRKKCFHHGKREAVARCPDCGRYFCRECITEHENRVLCADCLVQKETTKKKTHFLSRLGIVTKTLQFLIAFVFIWMIFFYFGQFLISLPTSFHEGTLWEKEWNTITGNE